MPAAYKTGLATELLLAFTLYSHACHIGLGAAMSQYENISILYF